MRPELLFHTSCRFAMHAFPDHSATRSISAQNHKRHKPRSQRAALRNRTRQTTYLAKFEISSYMQMKSHCFLPQSSLELNDKLHDSSLLFRMNTAASSVTFPSGPHGQFAEYRQGNATQQGDSYETHVSLNMPRTFAINIDWFLPERTVRVLISTCE